MTFITDYVKSLPVYLPYNQVKVKRNNRPKERKNKMPIRRCAPTERRLRLLKLVRFVEERLRSVGRGFFVDSYGGNSRYPFIFTLNRAISKPNKPCTALFSHFSS